MTYTDEQLQAYADCQMPIHAELSDICRELLEARKRIQQLEASQSYFEAGDREDRS